MMQWLKPQTLPFNYMIRSYHEGKKTWGRIKYLPLPITVPKIPIASMQVHAPIRHHHVTSSLTTQAKDIANTVLFCITLNYNNTNVLL